MALFFLTLCQACSSGAIGMTEKKGGDSWLFIAHPVTTPWDLSGMDSLHSVVTPWLGTPYLYGGNGPDSIDCSAFVREVYGRLAGLELPRRAAWQALQGYDVASPWLEKGDLVFFANPGEDEINHVGVYLGARRFVHATVSHGVRYSSLDEPYWRERHRKSIRMILPLQESID